MLEQVASRLTLDDAQRLFDAVARIGAQESQTDFLVAACREVHEILPGAWAQVDHIDLRSGESDLHAWPEHPDGWREEYLALHLRHADVHPTMARVFADTFDGTAVWDSADISEEFRQSPLFKRFYGRRGITTQAGIRIPSPPQQVTVVSVARAGGEFDQRELNLLTQLRPHLANLMELFRWRERARKTSALLTTEGWKTAIVDRGGRIVAATEAARLLADALGVRLDAGRSILATDLWSRVTTAAAASHAMISLPTQFGTIDVLRIDRGENALLLFRRSSGHDDVAPAGVTAISGALSPDDQDMLLAAIARIGRAETLDEFSRTACRELHAIVPGLWASYYETNLLSGRAAWSVWPERADEGAGLDVFAEFAHQNPLLRYVADGGSRVRTLDELDPTGDFRSTELYRQYYGLRGARSQAAFGLPAPAGVVIALAVNRDGTPFAERELRLMDELRLHLANIYGGVTAREHASRMSEHVRHGGWETLLLGHDGVVVDSTPQAVRLGAEIGMPLGVGDSLAQTELWAMILSEADAEGEAAERRFSLRLPTERGSVSASITTHPVGPYVLLLRADMVTVEAVMELGLTRRQAEVALQLVDGATNQQIASALGIAEGTARKHVETILAILDVPSRAAAAGVVARVGSQA